MKYRFVIGLFVNGTIVVKYTNPRNMSSGKHPFLIGILVRDQYLTQGLFSSYTAIIQFGPFTI